MRVPYINLSLQHIKDKEAILEKVSQVIDSGMFILGDEVEKFEKQFATLCGTKYAVGVGNGTDSLILSMKAMGIGPGDEVITAPNSYLASASSIELIGATVVFADVRDDFNLDPLEVEKKVTAKTKAIIAVHLTGRPAPMDELMAIAKKHNLFVIEDAAQAVGAEYKGKVVGGIGDMGSFSLHPLKNLSAIGDAGMITTNNEQYYKYLLKARSHGHKSRDECEFWSMNSRIDALQAAILNIKILRLPDWTNRRRAIAEKYRSSFGHLVEVPQDKEYEKAVYHTFIIKTDRRDELKAYLQDKGIDTKIHYPIPIHKQEAAKNNLSAKDSYPVTESQIKRILSIPVYPKLTDDQVNYICESVNNFFNHDS
jgi:dTDP-4-amino-4,6-dideoxygalactose transaminase